MKQQQEARNGIDDLLANVPKGRHLALQFKAPRPGRTKVYELLRRRELASVTIGAARRAPVGALEAYIERLVKEQPHETP